MQSAYFDALTATTSVATAVEIMSALNQTLEVQFATRLARNVRVAKDLTRYFQSEVVLNEFFTGVADLTGFISAGCNSLSTTEDLSLVQAWSTDEYGAAWASAIEAAINTCINGEWAANNQYMVTNFEQFKQWSCANAGMDCTTVEFEEDPFGANNPF